MDDGKAALHLDDDNPWPGPAAYTEASQRFFYGREAETTELLRVIRLAPFVTLYGKSGLGKSSLLQAGLFPQLRAARFLPVYLRLDYSGRSGPALMTQAALRLRQEIDAAGADAPPPEPDESLWAYLQRRERPIWTADNFPLTPVLVFDQFEEVFSRTDSPSQVKAILECMADLVGDRMSTALAEDRDAARRLNLQSQQYRVVLSFRSEFLADVETWEHEANLPKRESFHLKALSCDAAIASVARAGAAVLEPGVATQIVDFVRDRDSDGIAGRTSEVEPVLLSLCCYQLNSRRQRPAKIDAALLRSVGEDILEDFYRESLAGLRPEVAVFIEDNLIQGDRYRSTFPRDEALASGALTADELETLMQRRLLRVDPQGEVPRVELIHDRMVGVVRESRDKRVAREQHLRQLAEAEERRLAGKRESEALRQRERAEQAERERARVARWRNGFALSLLLLGIATGWLVYFAVSAEASARRAEAERAKAVASGRRADALRLIVESDAMLTGARGPNDTRAFQQIMAALKLHSDPDVDGTPFDALTSRQHLRRFAPVEVVDESPMIAVTFSPDGRTIATGHDDGSVALRSLDDLKTVRARGRGHAGPVQSVAFSHDGRRLLSGGDDGIALQWNVDDLSPVGEPLRGHSGPIYGAVYDRDDSAIVTGGRDGTVRRWDARSGRPTHAPLPMQSGTVWGVALSPSQRVIAVATSAPDKRPGGSGDASWLTLLDADTLAVKTKLFAHSDETTAVAFSPDGSSVVTGGADDTVRRRVLTGDQSQSTRMTGHSGNVQSVAFSPDGRYIASSSVDKTVRLWLASSGQPLGAPLAGHTRDVTSVAFSPDGRWLASASDDGSLLMWELDPSWAPTGAGATSRAVGDEGGGGTIGAIAPDGAAGLFVQDGTLHAPDGGEFFDPENVDGAPFYRCGTDAQRSQRAMNGRRGGLDVLTARTSTLAAYSPDGHRFVSGHSDGSLHRWDATTRRPIATPIAASSCAIDAVAWSADGRVIVAVSRNQALVFDASGRTAPARVTLGDEARRVTAVALSADGRWLTVADTGVDGGPRDTPGIAVHDLLGRSAAPRSFQRVPAAVSSLATSPDGKYLVSGYVDGQIAVWLWTTGTALGKPVRAVTNGPVVAVAFRGDGERFVSGSREGSTRPWPAPGAWAALMCAKVPSNLSRRHWRDWVSPDVPYECTCPGLPIEPDPDAAVGPPERCSAPRPPAAANGRSVRPGGDGR